MGDSEWARLLAALETDCPRCAGAGQVYSEAWQAWHERAGELSRVAQAAWRASGMRRPPPGEQQGGDAPTVLATIERAIEEHERTRPEEAEHITCGTCGGTGLVPTEAGLRLADVLRRHGFRTGTDGGRA
ncbi:MULTISPECIES: hypothetical protein [Thermomonospora]|uniref:Ribonuclease G/E n=1 Tax=Thermomonospora cellulosilytica TaxID=1411118 RepID=A0A7W3MWV4_9ACTN|nr:MULTISPECIES: hypothetical protein [Thermomonospora]MBA9003292.1 Ribonuclease G/E [Thermomonospora cellulosilytica]